MNEHVTVAVKKKNEFIKSYFYWILIKKYFLNSKIDSTDAFGYVITCTQLNLNYLFWIWKKRLSKFKDCNTTYNFKGKFFFFWKKTKLSAAELRLQDCGLH